MVTAENISFNIGKKNILKDITFNVIPGELLAIVGANGAGKSSLLKILSGDVKGQGQVKFHNTSIHKYKTKELAKVRAVLSQSFSLNLPYTVEEVVMMGRYSHFNELPNKEDYDVIRKVMEITSVGHLDERIYTSLSGGEQQRVQLSRVLAQIWSDDKLPVSSPKYLFLDEPVSSLDLLHQHKILDMANELKKKGYVVIAVLHDLNLASQYADTTLMLKNGSAVSFGKTSDVLSAENILKGFDIPVTLIRHPEYHYPIIVPDVLSKTSDRKPQLEFIN